jgi:hypothetical protein
MGTTVASFRCPAFHRSTAMSATSKNPKANMLSSSHGPPMMAVLCQSPPFAPGEMRESMSGVTGPACLLGSHVSTAFPGPRASGH